MTRPVFAAIVLAVALLLTLTVRLSLSIARRVAEAENLRTVATVEACRMLRRQSNNSLHVYHGPPSIYGAARLHVPPESIRILQR